MLQEQIGKLATGIFGIDIFGGQSNNNQILSQAYDPTTGSIKVSVQNATPGSGLSGTNGSDGGVKDQAQQASDSWGGFAEQFSRYGVMFAGTFATILASGGNFKVALIGLFASMFAQILINAATKNGGIGSGLFSWVGGLFGKGGADLSGVASGAGPMASGAALDSLSTEAANNIASGAIGMASGGRVIRFAAGGMAGRDTVPAWLEPGEFVMRKSAVDAHGLAAMNKINSGVPSNPNVSVNVNNQGTPQQVQGKPNVRFDSNKMVVDIVLKDFQNNGPIRQTLRGTQF
jgi:hypothetical protein